jgi:hypothetical protein
VSYAKLTAKLIWMWLLMLLLVTLARAEVDFIYRGF